MSISITKEKLVDIVQGETVKIQEKIIGLGLEYDSREIRGGEIFIALKGENSHGERFLSEAFARGASIAIVEDKNLLSNKEFIGRIVVVPDTLKAFWSLARWWRSELNIPVLAVTGSVGKTTTKEILASILLTKGQGAYSQKSYNNHVGVPYTICRISRQHNWAILEMGMNHKGELCALSDLATPDLALITAIGPAHIQSFSGVDEIADAKYEILAGLKPNGVVILNRDDAVLMSGLTRSKILPSQKVVFFGTQGKVELSITNIASLGLDGISFTFKIGEESVDVLMKIPGKHNVFNAAAAALAAKMVIPDLTLNQIKLGLEKFRAPLMRLNIKEYGEDQKIIDDSYNASPKSMEALLDLATDLMREGQTVGLVLGSMRELGGFSEDLHRKIGLKVAEVQPKFLVTVGADARFIAEEALKAGVQCEIVEEVSQAADVVRNKRFDILMVKGSRAVGLDKLVQQLVTVQERQI